MKLNPLDLQVADDSLRRDTLPAMSNPRRAPDVPVKEWSASRVIEQIDSVDTLHQELLAVCKPARDQLTPGLLAIAHEGAGVALLNASILLILLHDIRGTEGLVRILSGTDPGLVRTTLIRLSLAGPSLLGPATDLHNVGPPGMVPVLQARVDGPALFAALEPHFGDLTTEQSRTAFTVALRAAPPERYDQLTAMLEHRLPEVRALVVDWLAKRGIDRGALDAIGPLLVASVDARHALSLTLGALETYATISEYAARAGEVAAAYVDMRLGERYEGGGETSEFGQALDVVRSVAPPFERALLERVVASEVAPWHRSAALRRLVELGAARTTIELFLDHAVVRGDAAVALATLGSAASGPALDRALDAELDGGGREGVLQQIVQALVATGAGVGDALSRIEHRLDPWSRALTLWLRDGYTPTRIAALLALAGVAKKPNARRLAKLEQTWSAEPDAFQTFYELVGEEHVHIFDAGSSAVPPDYVDLIEELARTSRGILDLDRAKQSPTAATISLRRPPKVVTVDVTAGGDTRTFEAAFAGSWFDVRSVLDALDAWAVASGRPERFFSLHTGEQSCVVVCAPEDGFRRVASELHIPIVERAALRSHVAVPPALHLH